MSRDSFLCALAIAVALALSAKFHLWGGAAFTGAALLIILADEVIAAIKAPLNVDAHVSVTQSEEKPKQV